MKSKSSIGWLSFCPVRLDISPIKNKIGDATSTSVVNITATLPVKSTAIKVNTRKMKNPKISFLIKKLKFNLPLITSPKL